MQYNTYQLNDTWLLCLFHLHVYNNKTHFACSSGSGGYADNNSGAVSTTGHGESILKVCLAKNITHLLEQGNNINCSNKTLTVTSSLDRDLDDPVDEVVGFMYNH